MFLLLVVAMHTSISNLLGGELHGELGVSSRLCSPFLMREEQTSNIVSWNFYVTLLAGNGAVFRAKTEAPHAGTSPKRRAFLCVDRRQAAGWAIHQPRGRCPIFSPRRARERVAREDVVL